MAAAKQTAEVSSSAARRASSAETEELLWFLKKIRAVRAQLAATKTPTLRTRWFEQKLDGLISEVTSPGADRVTILRLLEAYAVGAELWPLAFKRQLSSTKHRANAAATQEKIRKGKGAKKTLRFAEVPAHPLEERAVERLRFHKRSGKVGFAAYSATAKDLGVSKSALEKRILTPARAARRIPLSFRKL